MEWPNFPEKVKQNHDLCLMFNWFQAVQMNNYTSKSSIFKENLL